MKAVNDATLALIKEFEGLRLNAYRDGGGVVTIGYGTTAAADVGIAPKMGDTITKGQADIYLERALDKFADQIRPLITRPVVDNQFGAMMSLAYNIGPRAFSKSTLLRKFNAGDTDGAANEFARWNKDNGKVVKGLVRRRSAERELFLRDASDTPAPATAGWFMRLMRAIFGGGK